MTAFTAAAAILDFVKALPKNSDVIVKLQEMLGAVSKMLRYRSMVLDGCVRLWLD